MPKHHSPASKPDKPVVFEDEFVSKLTHIFEERIVFNQVLGLKITRITPEVSEAHIDMKHELVGHFSFNRLHGGVVAASLDALGGIAVLAAVCARHMDEPVDQRLLRFSKLGTIDLRIDYLRPAISDRFLMRAQVLRAGSRVGSTRMDFMASDGKLLCTGAGAYIVS